MKGSGGIFGLVLAVLAVGILSSGEVKAQSAAEWGGYAPSVTWAAPTSVPAAAPAATAIPATSSGWEGYAPATSWAAYQPQASWAGYTPQGVWSTATVASPTVHRQGGVVGSRNPEYGTGRTIAMIKPWLPASPR